MQLSTNTLNSPNYMPLVTNPRTPENHPAVAVAIALVKSQVFMKEFFECYDDPWVIELGQKIEVYADPEIDKVFPSKIGTRVEIITKNKHISMFEEDKQPIPYSFIKEKFATLSSTQLSEKNVEKIIEMIDGLERLETVTQLSELVS